jgi:hypothetical protein
MAMMMAIATNRTTFIGLLGLSAGLGSGVILFLRLWMWFNVPLSSAVADSDVYQVDQRMCDCCYECRERKKRYCGYQDDFCYAHLSPRFVQRMQKYSKANSAMWMMTEARTQPRIVASLDSDLAAIGAKGGSFMLAGFLLTKCVRVGPFGLCRLGRESGRNGWLL